MRTPLPRALARLLAPILLIGLILAPSSAESRGRQYRPHHGADVWADLAHCESTHGAQDPNLYQFALSTWRNMPERAGVPGTHTPGEQLASAKWNLAHSRKGPGEWPYCGRAVGLQRSDAYPLPPITG